ncbi:MAG: LD-carboxypeptidase [Oscillospiraceae bacterium]|jgi:muramoyltetrapeptide carboxypeptidase|nr:LD-carboxypeptidase [Oscillospiraceae bacterium]
MLAQRLNYGDAIGIFFPSHIPEPERFERNIWTLERLGFKVKLGENAEKDTYGYAASAEERAADLNALVADDNVKMVLFGGGDSAAEILPHIDYDGIRRRPKLFTSYSDGTVILNAIYSQTGLVTYYGSGPGIFEDLRLYNWEQFKSHFVAGQSAAEFVSDSKWRTLRGGSGAGTLIGGYTALFAALLGSPYFKYDRGREYLLLLEDHERYSSPAAVATWLAFAEQSELMKNVKGLIFGHYAVEAPDELLRLLERFGERNNIPVVYTDDFGHGTKHAILPIGVDAALDADKQTLTFLGERK